MNEKETQTDETVSTNSGADTNTTPDTLTSATDSASVEAAVEVSAETEPVTETESNHASSDQPVTTVSETAVVNPEEKEGDAVAVPVPDAEQKDTVEDEVPLTTKVVSALSAIKVWCMARKYTIASIVLVIVGLVLFTFMLEQQGRINTGLFDTPKNFFSARSAVATVNGEKITRGELDESISQITLGAAAQGVDTTDTELMGQIQQQALDMLVNTELLLQKAAQEGISVTEADVDARIEQLRTDLGGAEQLTARMQEFGIDDKTLRRDIRSELTIQQLLDAQFATKGIEVTDEEVAAFYESAGGSEAGLPPLEEVTEQIKQQISSTKEQEVVNGLIEQLRSEGTVEILL